MYFLKCNRIIRTYIVHLSSIQKPLEKILSDDVKITKHKSHGDVIFYVFTCEN